MPQKLATWWRVNIPHQPIVADSLERFELDPGRGISILKFGVYWGELCLHYASRIDWTMAMGTAYLLAERYGTILVHSGTEILDLAPQLENCSDDEFAELLKPLIVKQLKMASYFFEVYPRDDFQDAYAAQPSAFRSNAHECIEILNDPKSTGGSWDM
jgi:hypothetical protein